MVEVEGEDPPWEGTTTVTAETGARMTSSEMELGGSPVWDSAT